MELSTLKKSAFALNTIGTVVSGAQAISQIVLGPWQTVAGVVAGCVLSIFVSLGFRVYYNGWKILVCGSPELNAYHFGWLKSNILTSSLSGFLLPTQARFGFIKQLATTTSGPFINGMNFGFTGANFFISGVISDVF